MSIATMNNGRDGIRGALIAGFAVMIVILGGFGAWAMTAQLAGAVLASGTVVVDSNVKKVQHATGGTVGEIRVKDGDRVAAGDLLIKLDETQVRANLQIITKQLDELAIRQARLTAERDGADTIASPASFAARLDAPEIDNLIASERTLFESRAKARAGQKAQLRERIAQLGQEIDGLKAQAEAKDSENEFVEKELDGARQLWRQNLMPVTKFTSLQREAARLKGERAQLVSQGAQARGKISETELQILQIDQDMRAEVMRDLREAQGKDAELSERRIAAEDQLKHIEIRAPRAGVVHQLSTHTVGGVIGQGEPVMLIVPEGDALVVEAKIAPQDINNVRQGQGAYIQFTAFDQRTTPEYQGQVLRVSADLSKDAQTGTTYYVARLSLTGTVDGQPVADANSLKLVPGMPAEVHIRTGERTAMTYLMKPLSDQFARAFTER